MATIMLFAMALTASAIDAVSTEKLTVTVNGTDGATYKFYKVADVAVSGEAYVYTVLSPFSDAYSADDISKVDQDSASALLALADGLANLVTTQTDLAASLVYNSGVNGTAATSVSLDPGYYLMVVENSDATMTAANSLFTIITAGTTLTPKTSEVSMTKKIVDDMSGASPRDTSTADIGDDIIYRIQAEVPKYDSSVISVANYSITDNPSNGLTIKQNSSSVADVTVKVGTETVAASNYTVTNNSDGGFTVTFTSDWVLGNGGKTVDVYFTATLNKNAVVANTTNTLTGYETASDVEDELYTTGNPNGATLTYSNNYKDGTGSETIKDIVTTYTFELNIKKTGEDDDADGLAGAVFTVYTDDACTETYTNTDFDGTLTTSGTYGTATAKGLDAGIYYIKETTAPNGYTLNETVFKVVITAHVDDSSNYDGKYSYTITKVGSSDPATEQDIEADKLVTIADTKGLTMPGTGGIGTTIFTFGGLALVILAAIMFIVYTKKQRKQA
ncbi:MAG: SpaH/EbpB family LPXTG-anchored major pilin [Lachnospiraceae bacterium]|nr:SpaH/EbpB family LPXTG-anchored major pilin [Lachnospiraceae bacterium]